jgi:hypothetical protein
MPAYKGDLSPEDRWAVIAFQHSLSGHNGPHTPAEHPAMQGAVRQHPEPRDPRLGSQWVTRDHRWQPRGPWKDAVIRQLPQLYREFNGIDFGHAHLAETLLKTQEPERIEQARLDVVNFIFSSPAVPPDEEQVAPTVNRLAWEVTKTFDWAHIFHRSLYDLFSSDKVKDKEAAYRRLLADYLEKPEAITPHRLDHHRALWEFEESKAFRDKFPKFNTQIWAYHWLQAAVYDVQLLGDVKRQQELMPKVIAFYHGYLRRPPVEWQFMPMMPEAAPNFAKQFPEAASIFDNLHMLHDNFDDILVRPDLFPTMEAKRAAILRILPIYLHRNHGARDLYPEFHEPPAGAHGGHGMDMGPRPPSVHEVLAGTAPPSDQPSRHNQPPASRSTSTEMRTTMPTTIRASAAVLVLLLGVAQAYAIDHKNLDERRPTRLDDAYAISTGEIAVEAGAGFRLPRHGADQGFFPVEVLYGALPLPDRHRVHDLHRSARGG